MLVAHLGLTTKGSIGAQTALSRWTRPPSASRRCTTRPVAVRKDVLVLCHGGPIAEPADVEHLLARTSGIDGFFGASSIERFATEAGIEQQAEAIPIDCAADEASVIHVEDVTICDRTRRGTRTRLIPMLECC